MCGAIWRVPVRRKGNKEMIVKERKLRVRFQERNIKERGNESERMRDENSNKVCKL